MGLALALLFQGPNAHGAATVERVVASLESRDLGGVEHPFFLLAREWSLALELLRGRGNETSARRILDGELGLRLLEAHADRMDVEAART